MYVIETMIIGVAVIVATLLILVGLFVISSYHDWNGFFPLVGGMAISYGAGQMTGRCLYK